MQKERLISIRVRTAAPAWLCIFRYVKLRVYKHLLKINLWGFCTSLISCQFVLSFSLSLPLVFRLIFGRQRLYAFTFLSGLLGPTQEGVQGGATSAIQVGPLAYENRAGLLSWDFISYLCKPRNISLILSSNFLTAVLPPSIILSL